MRSGAPARGEGWQAWLFVAPAALLFGVFVLFPLASSLYYGFTRWNGFSAPEWIGLTNYVRAFQDRIHLASYLHVTLYTLGTLVVEVAFGLVLAVLLNAKRPGFALFRVLCFSPVVLSMVAAGLLWTFVYDLRLGLLNSLLTDIGLGGLRQAWLANPNTALTAVTIVSGWKFAGFYMIIFLAALRRIPAAHSASSWKARTTWRRTWAAGIGGHWKGPRPTADPLFARALLRPLSLPGGVASGPLAQSL